jgi:hypothetical protein
MIRARFISYVTLRHKDMPKLNLTANGKNLRQGCTAPIKSGKAGKAVELNKPLVHPGRID